MQPISFKARIPLYKCSVKDIKTGKNIPVVVSEFDCKDVSDMQEMAGLGYKWQFAMGLAADMEQKYLYNKNFHASKINYPLNFYVLHEDKEDKYGEVNILGICETENNGKNADIAFIESKYKEEYKYVGQTLLAAIGKLLLKNNGHNIYVLNPAFKAIPFYMDKCGFEQVDKDKYAPLWLQQEQIKEFIKRTEEKTGSELIDIKG